MTIEVRCMREPWADAIGIAVLEKRTDGTVAVGEPFTMRELSPGAFIGEPTVRLKTTQAQMLMDELWNCGLRPSEGTVRASCATK